MPSDFPSILDEADPDTHLRVRKTSAFAVTHYEGDLECDEPTEFDLERVWMKLYLLMTKRR